MRHYVEKQVGKKVYYCDDWAEHDTFTTFLSLVDCELCLSAVKNMQGKKDCVQQLQQMTLIAATLRDVYEASDNKPMKFEDDVINFYAREFYLPLLRDMNDAEVVDIICDGLSSLTFHEVLVQFFYMDMLEDLKILYKEYLS